MTRKEPFKSKNQLINKILKYVDKIQGEAIIDEENKTISAKFNATMTGGYMANDGFTPKQLEQLGLVMDAKIQPINERLTNIENRLDVIEEDVKTLKEDVQKIKNCPTIKKELDELE